MPESKVAAPKTIGVSIFLVVFVSLCLFTFAAISLSTAKNDLDAARKTADRQSACYAACREAEAFIAGAQADAAGGHMESSLTKTFAIDENRTLTVELSPSEDGGSYRIASYRIESAGEWEETQSVTWFDPT